MNDITVRRAPLLACGVAAGPLFIAVLLMEGMLRPGYDPLSLPVSALSLGPRGWIQIANFVLSGLLLIAFAVGVRRAVPSPVGATLIAGFGLAVVASGVFTMDPPGTPASWEHQAHEWAGLAVFLFLPAACFVLARRMGGIWRVYSLVTGVVGVVLLVWFGTAWEQGTAYAGLIQRIMIVANWGWITLLAVQLLRNRAP